MASSFSSLFSNGQQKECYVAMASSYSKFYPRMAHKRDATLRSVGWLLLAPLAGGCWLVGWLAGLLPQGVHTKMLISWQARVLEMKCRFRGAGGVGGGAAPPPAAQHADPNKTSVGCKDETAQCVLSTG